MTLFIIDGTRDWLSILNIFLKNIKVKGRQCLDYDFYLFVYLKPHKQLECIYTWMNFSKLVGSLL